MDREPLVTVYITNYNYGRFVRSAIESVLRQTFSDYELLIVDDGSTDNSREVIAAYEGRKGIRIILQQNKGLNATNNVCVRAAQGKYVMRLDADDYLDENALLVLVKALEADPRLALVFPDWYYVDESGTVTGQERRHDFANEVTLLDQPAHGACTMTRRDCLIEVGAYSEEFRCQDGYDLWLKIIDRYPVRNVNLPLFYYRRHGENLTGQNELILRTRSEILKLHAERASRPALTVAAVLPVRGPGVDTQCLSRRTLGDKPLIDWTIGTVLESENIKELIVSSPDETLLDAIGNTWGSRVVPHCRSREQATRSLSYGETALDAVSQSSFASKADALMLLNVNFPFRSSFYLDKAVNVMRVFADVDAVLGVWPDNDLFFQSDGGGLKPIGNNPLLKEMRLERDFLYRHAGGAVLVRRAYYQQNRGSIARARIGHYVLSRLAATAVRVPLDLRIAEALFGAGDLKEGAR